MCPVTSEFRGFGPMRKLVLVAAVCAALMGCKSDAQRQAEMRRDIAIAQIQAQEETRRIEIEAWESTRRTRIVASTIKALAVIGAIFAVIFVIGLFLNLRAEHERERTRRLKLMLKAINDPKNGMNSTDRANAIIAATQQSQPPLLLNYRG